MALNISKLPTALVLEVGSVWVATPSTSVTYENLSSLSCNNLFVGKDGSIDFSFTKLSETEEVYQIDLSKLHSEYGINKVEYLLISNVGVNTALLLGKGVFVGWVRFDQPINTETTELMRVTIDLSNNLVINNAFQVNLKDQYRTHSLTPMNEAHSEVVVSEDHTEYSYIKPMSSHDINQMLGLIPTDYSNILVDSSVENLKSRDLGANNSIISLYEYVNGDTTKKFTKTVDNYLDRRLKFNYNLNKLLSNESSGYYPRSSVMYTPLNRDYFKYSYLTVDYPLGVVPYTIVPLNSICSDFYLIIGGSNACKYDRVYLIKDLGIGIKDKLSDYQKPIIHFELNLIYLNIGNKSYVINPVSEDKLSDLEYVASVGGSCTKSGYIDQNSKVHVSCIDEVIFSEDTIEVSDGEYVLNLLDNRIYYKNNDLLELVDNYIPRYYFSNEIIEPESDSKFISTEFFDLVPCEFAIQSKLNDRPDADVSGYYSEGNFYSDSSLTTLINPVTGYYYKDLITNRLYQYIASSYKLVNDVCESSYFNESIGARLFNFNSFEHSEYLMRDLYNLTYQEFLKTIPDYKLALIPGGDINNNPYIRGIYNNMLAAYTQLFILVNYYLRDWSKIRIYDNFILSEVDRQYLGIIPLSHRVANQHELLVPKVYDERTLSKVESSGDLIYFTYVGSDSTRMYSMQLGELNFLSSNNSVTNIESDRCYVNFRGIKLVITNSGISVI